MSRRGFTLIEVVVGLAVGGIVILTGFTALATVQDRAVHAKEASLDAMEGATARATIIDWIGGARLRSSELGEEFQGLNAREHALPSDELMFPTSARTPLGTPVTFVRLHLGIDPNLPERGLVAELVGGLGEEARRVELVPQATGIEFRYLPDVAGAEEWETSWLGRGELPRGIELVLRDDPANPLPPLLRKPIRVPLATLR